MKQKGMIVMMKKTLVLILTLALLIPALGGITSAESSYSGVVSIVHVNDVHGYVAETDKAIGYAKISGFVDEMKANNPDTLVLDAGDVFTGNSYATFDRGESLTAVLNTIGFDAMTAGNSDFSLGLTRLLELRAKLNYPMLAGNMVATETGKTPLDGYTIITLDNGMDVGIIGITTPMSTTGLSATDPIKTAAELMAKVKPQVDLVVGLVHLGDNPSAGVTSIDLANEVKGFDVIIDGHSHTVLKEGTVANGTLIAQTGEQGNNIGVVDLKLEAGKVTAASARLVTRAEMENAKENAETAAVVKALQEDCDKAMAEVVGYTETYILGTREIVRTQETNAGNLFTDALRKRANADIGIVWAGPVGGEIEVGPITRQDILSIVRADSNVIKVEMTGADIINALNVMVKDYPSVSGSFPQVSGISFKFDPERVGDRVFDAAVQGEPLRLDQTYTVATYEAFFDVLSLPKNATKLEEYGYATTIIEDYIKANSPISPQTEGRIVVAAKPPASFSDVSDTSWFYEAVRYVAGKGLFVGTSDTTFEPEAPMTRAMFATVLGRLAESMGEKIDGVGTTPPSGYTDVDWSSWYGKYLAWEVNNGIVMGYGDGLLAPNDNMTREQMATLIQRFTDYMEVTLKTGSPKVFTDTNAISGWAKNAVDMASAAGIINGYKDGSFGPARNTTRAEAATVLMGIHRQITSAEAAE